MQRFDPPAQQRHPRGRQVLPLAMAALLTLASGTSAADGPLVGQEQPTLELSHTLQGPAWSQQQLLGSVVVLDVFQLG